MRELFSGIVGRTLITVFRRSALGGNLTCFLNLGPFALEFSTYDARWSGRKICGEINIHGHTDNHHNLSTMCRYDPEKARSCKMNKIASLIAAALLFSGCGSMSFGESALNTLGVFLEASDIKQCYEAGGTRELCEERW